MIDKIKSLLNKRKCTKRGHHWFCQRMQDNSMICLRFYKWICLTCSKEEVTTLSNWVRSTCKNLGDELDIAIPKELR